MATLTRVDAISDRTLRRLIKGGIVVLVLMVAAFSVIYYFGQRHESGPSIAERQVSAAEAAVTKAPQNVQNRLRLALAYQAADRLDDAVAQYNEVLKAVPTNATALLGLGRVLVDKGDNAGAKPLFTKVTQTASKGEFAAASPELQSAHYFLGTIAVSENDLTTAQKELKAALTIDPADADTWYTLGTVQTKVGDNKSAVQSLQRALLFVPTGWCEPYAALQTAYTGISAAPEAEYAGAMLDFCNGKPGPATERLTALTSSSASIDALLGLGLIAETTSDRTAAVDWYQKVLTAQPGNTTALTALSRLNATPAPAASTPKVK